MCSNLSMKQGSLYCFVLFVTLRSPNPRLIDATLLVSSETSWWVGVHWLGLGLFGATVWKLLIIEQFSQWKLNKIETENCIWIWGHSWWCWWKAHSQSDLIEFISQFSELKVWKILIFKWILLLEIQQIAEIGFGRKNQLSPQLCSHCHIYKFSILKMWKIKNAFTLRPTE
jgi:hypothetical protein